MTELWQLDILSDPDTAFEIAEALGFEDGGEAQSVSIFEDPQGRRVEAIFLSETQAETVRARLGGAVSRVENKDWVSESQSGLGAVRAGRFLLHGSHEDPSVIASADIPVLVDAGLAFGTGHHGTTKGCLEVFDACLKAGTLPQRVLDLGCGSGILAISAAKALGGKIRASDIDPDAVMVTRENAVANGVADHVDVWQADGLSNARFETYDLIFANILAGPLMSMAADIADVSDGDVILSGILNEQADAVADAFARVGLATQSRHIVDEWTTLLATQS